MAIKLDKTKLTRTIASKAKLLPHLDRHLDADGEFPWKFDYEPKRFDDAWHPSGDCTPSMRDLYLKATGQLEARPISAQLRRTFMVGHFWHQYLQWIIEKRLEFCGPDDVERQGKIYWGDLTPVVVDLASEWDLHNYHPLPDEQVRPECNLHSEVGTRGEQWHGVITCDTCGNFGDLKYVKQYCPKKSPNHAYGVAQSFHWATGSADIAPCDIPGHGKFIVDFKTMKESDFKQVKLHQRLPGWCAAKYEAQMNIYMKWFEIDRAIIVAIDKNSSDMEEFEMEYNPALADAVEDKWKLVSACVSEGLEPPEDEIFPLPFKES